MALRGNSKYVDLQGLLKQKKAQLRAALAERRRLEQLHQRELEDARRAAEQEKSAAVEEERQKWQEIARGLEGQLAESSKPVEETGRRKESGTYRRQETPVEEPSSHPQESALRLALLAQQTPGLEKFRGEDVASGGDTIQDWLEQPELLAEAFEWSLERDVKMLLESWKDSVRVAMRRPSVTLHACNHTMLELVAETEVTLECGTKQVRTTVLVQDAAPQKLLLGTNAPRQLGFQLSQVEATEESVPAETSSGPVTVKLLGVTKIPARFQKVLQVKTSPEKLHSTIRVESGQTLQREEVEPAVVETDRKGEAVTVIKNHNVEPVVLEEDQAVGTGEAIEIVQPAGGVSNQLLSHGCFSCSVDNNGRVQLLQALDWRPLHSPWTSVTS